ncbi:hypothetical protein [Shewanella halotolerans]|uniref:hypothetical protein n=1 Tax=Shewanella halotolerans TaxID=2864204 RepID=UPI001C65682B|nr:hypothetical protein [Shewanella halotolerans]QYJ90486.1 hypothetical protein K0H81_02470 [Shewanella halotolerans]
MKKYFVIVFFFILQNVSFSTTANEGVYAVWGDAPWVPPRVTNVDIYWCMLNSNFYGGNSTPNKVSKSECGDWFLSSHDAYYSSSIVKTTNSGGFFDGDAYKVSYTTVWIDPGINDPVSGVHPWGYVYEQGSISSLSCLFPDFSYEVDFDEDGKVDRCYNPEDKLKIRTKLDFDDTCHESPFISIDHENYPEVYTLSTEDENLVASSAKEAVDFLAQMSSDLNNPSALNKEKLDSISRVFNISDSSQPLFNTLSNVILKVNECVSSRLEGAQLAPNENMYRVKTDKAAQSSIFARTCYIGSSEEPQIEITERSLKDYKEGVVLPFINTLPVTMMHENQHHCGGSHMISSDESDFRLKEKAWLKNRLEMFELQKNYMDELSRQKYFESILKDPSFYEYII